MENILGENNPRLRTSLKVFLADHKLFPKILR